MDIRIAEDFWAGRMLPEGIVERWIAEHGSQVEAGAPVAEVRIEDSLHEIIAPVSGRLVAYVAKNDIVEPGSVIGQIA
ncbi:MAG: biotin attachment protein [Bradyrhizobiaceae bacterium]|nr:MAG: biotin attachment protein [Bradyrhizobiaceae bacterium]